MVDTVPLSAFSTKAVLLSGVTATPAGVSPTVMSVGFLVLVSTSIVDTEPVPTPMPLLVTKAVFPSGVNASPTGNGPTGMSVGFLVLVVTSMVDTDPLPALETNAVARHRHRPATADTPGATPTSAPANPNTTTTRTHRNRRIPCAPASLSSPAPVGLNGRSYVAVRLQNVRLDLEQYRGLSVPLGR